MGREIRRVPHDWKHPVDEDGQAHPLFDRDFETEARKWVADCIAWENGTHKDVAEFGRYDDGSRRYFWEWDGGPPDREYHRPAWTPEEADCYQMYETVTEGTPVSPVFETLDELREWLVGQGYSEEGARAFCETGWAPSMVLYRGTVTRDVEATVLLRQD